MGHTRPDEGFIYGPSSPAFTAPTLPRDSLEDVLAELIREGVGSEDILRKFFADEIREIQIQTAKRIVACLLRTGQNIRLEVDFLRYNTEMSDCMGETMVTLAAKHGISKQAFKQGLKRHQEFIGFERRPHQRSDEAKSEMRLMHYERPRSKD